MDLFVANHKHIGIFLVWLLEEADAGVVIFELVLPLDDVLGRLS